MASNYHKINPGTFAHICNRAIGNDLLFRRHEDYENWIRKIEHYIVPVAEIHAFTLMANHYHLVIRTLESTSHNIFSKQIGALQSSYSKSYNYIYERKGGLFLSPFNRIPIRDEAQLIWTIWYTHRNPLHHGITENWQDWKYSSYPLYLSNSPGFLTTNFCIELFGGLEQMKAHHNMNAAAYRKDQQKLALE